MKRTLLIIGLISVFGATQTMMHMPHVLSRSVLAAQNLSHYERLFHEYLDELQAWTCTYLAPSRSEHKRAEYITNLIIAARKKLKKCGPDRSYRSLQQLYSKLTQLEGELKTNHWPAEELSCIRHSLGDIDELLTEYASAIKAADESPKTPESPFE